MLLVLILLTMTAWSERVENLRAKNSKLSLPVYTFDYRTSRACFVNEFKIIARVVPSR